MSDPGPSRPTAATKLADELRALLLDLHRTKVSDDDLVALTEAVRDMRAGVTGPARTRWYEAAGLDDTEVAELRATWRDFTLFGGASQPLALPLQARIERDDEGDCIVGEVTANRMYEGPPGAVHGGYLAGLFDDMLGHTLRLVPDITAVTGKLSVRYRHPTPLDVPLRFVARVERVRGRRVQLHARCLVDDQVTAEAEGLFVAVALRGNTE